MVTDKQVQALWRLLTAGKVLSVAAVRSGMDDKTARKYRRLRRLPSELASRTTGERVGIPSRRSGRRSVCS